MPKITRRQHRQRHELTWADKTILETGCYWFGDSHWGDGPYSADTMAEMRDAWQDIGHEILAKRDPGWHFPWAWWLFEAPEPRNKALPEFEQLERLGMLTAADLEVLKGNAHGIRNEWHEDAFRRSWGWWRFLSPERRNWDVPELIQLAGMRDVLTRREKTILDDKIDPCARPETEKVRLFLSYHNWEKAEYEFLGLPPIDYDDEDDD